MLEVGYEFGDDRILLWLPWVAKHVITKDSPLSNWLSPSGFMADADSCIAVVVRPHPLPAPEERSIRQKANDKEMVRKVAGDSSSLARACSAEDCPQLSESWKM